MMPQIPNALDMAQLTLLAVNNKDAHTTLELLISIYKRAQQGYYELIIASSLWLDPKTIKFTMHDEKEKIATALLMTLPENEQQVIMFFRASGYNLAVDSLGHNIYQLSLTW